MSPTFINVRYCWPFVCMCFDHVADAILTLRRFSDPTSFRVHMDDTLAAVTRKFVAVVCLLCILLPFFFVFHFYGFVVKFDLFILLTSSVVDWFLFFNAC